MVTKNTLIVLGLFVVIGARTYAVTRGQNGQPPGEPASVLTANTAAAQLMSTCVENSPERQGEIGCSIIESKALPDGLKEPLFWHIDRFDSLERARTAVGPASIAFEAAGTSWLMTIESQTSDHHGGQHVAQVGPLPLPRAPKLSMNVISSAFAPGMYSAVHHHSGVEAFYVLEGEQCAETPTQGSMLRKGDTLAIPTGVPMRLLVSGSNASPSTSGHRS